MLGASAGRSNLQLLALLAGKFGGDDRFRQISYLTMRAIELWKLLKSPESISAKNTLAKAKSVLSPYFGVNDFAFAYVRT